MYITEVLTKTKKKAKSPIGAVWTVYQVARQLGIEKALGTDRNGKPALWQVIHERYKDLALVERAFRTSKTAELEMRPVYVQTEPSTRGHALVVVTRKKLKNQRKKR